MITAYKIKTGDAGGFTPHSKINLGWIIIKELFNETVENRQKMKL